MASTRTIRLTAALASLPLAAAAIVASASGASADTGHGMIIKQQSQIEGAHQTTGGPGLSDKNNFNDNKVASILFAP
ncbi:hypothetical protein OHB13_37425 (plasmid) [Streptomyces sp. NBC_00440]|uniref:hypothetical protein n=1 Tax=unclassified Streptomyces TaxID=2593676 RepID=UPI002E234A92|nr:hypothetical protein OG760_36780 [Streptomyces sp. NBC_00963]